jgi:hypothetical protein
LEWSDRDMMTIVSFSEQRDQADIAIPRILKHCQLWTEYPRDRIQSALPPRPGRRPGQPSLVNFSWKLSMARVLAGSSIFTTATSRKTS